MHIAAVVAHRHDATVTAAETAAHDAFDRNLTRTAVPFCDLCRGRQHALGSAGIKHHRACPARAERAIERLHDASSLACRAVFRREDQLDAAPPKKIKVEELGRATCAVE